jgi:hypothetical protein
MGGLTAEERDDPKTWEYHITKVEEKNGRARATEHEGMTSATWPPPRQEEGNFPHSLCKFAFVIIMLL